MPSLSTEASGEQCPGLNGEGKLLKGLTKERSGERTGYLN